MCGLAGFWSSTGRSGLVETALAMAARIAYRGPDDAGVWAEEAAGFALAHRRLSILDLSPAGHQPMHSAGGRWVLAYNGEIYNHQELRLKLESGGSAVAWRGHSDTETLLACIEAWGLERTLKASVGMFVLALWDRGERTLYLARDRIGEKPLYYGRQGGAFLFGSELKAFHAHPAFKARINRGALALLLRHNYVPEPHSIYDGIHKLSPGSWLRVGEDQRDVEPQRYWSLTDVAERGVSNQFVGSDIDALDALETRLGDAVRSQMAADVPLGALLSGGIDSSLITALMQANSSRPVRTFTIGFEERQYDETKHARDVAAHLGTEHTELKIGSDDALALIPEMPSIYDEPFADSSQLPTHLVMKLARQHVTVALSGDGGDELFGGYNRYALVPQVWKRVGWMPQALRAALGRSLMAFPVSAVNRVGALAAAHHVGFPMLGDKVYKLGMRLQDARSAEDFYIALVTEWRDAGNLVIGAGSPSYPLLEEASWPKLSDSVAQMMVMDALTYLPGDVLTKVDRAAMAVSLETRAPFLDRDVVEFAWTLPMSMKLRGGRGKWVLRRLLDRYVPPRLVERPKMGFGIPLDDWLRGPLREWAEALLSESRLRQEGYMDPTPIRKVWAQHLRGESLGYRLWSVLTFQAWLEQQERTR